jgi:hypothetical protein
VSSTSCTAFRAHQARARTTRGSRLANSPPASREPTAYTRLSAPNASSTSSARSGRTRRPGPAITSRESGAGVAPVAAPGGAPAFGTSVGGNNRVAWAAACPRVYCTTTHLSVDPEDRRRAAYLSGRWPIRRPTGKVLGSPPARGALLRPLAHRARSARRRCRPVPRRPIT